MNEDKVIKMLLKHDQDIDWVKENMVTREEYRADHQEILSNFDTLIKISKKNDQEITFMGERVTRVENDAQKLKSARGLV